MATHPTSGEDTRAGDVKVPARYSFGPPLDPRTRDIYRDAIQTLQVAQVPFLVGGAYAFERYTGISRHTKDLDIFLKREHFEAATDALSAAGFHTELTFPHWLGKAFYGEEMLDLIFSSGNGVARVDELWFQHAVDDTVMDLPCRLCPAEEIIWSKSFIMERERFDGADVAHILLVRGRQLDWPRMMLRFESHWRVLLSHLVLFGFIYPGERHLIPSWVLQELTGRLARENGTMGEDARACGGTLLSRAQYLADVDRWGYEDGRLTPRGNLSEEEIAHWTAAIDKG
ncbi:MAG: hypothetical protein AB2A00_42830 [Myxococcota bacterium]